MKSATFRRWLWRIFLFWTLLALVIWPFDVGEAQIKVWLEPSAFQRLVLGILRAFDAVWLVLAAANVYFYLILQEGLAVARRVGGVLIVGTGLALGIGVKTGWPFGPMIFTSQLGARLAGVPFSVLLLWFVIIVVSRYTVLHFREHASRWQIAVTTGLLVVATDLSLEWVAWRVRGYWLWYFPLANTPDWPPLQNYASWLVLSAALTWLAFPAVRPAGRHVQPLVMLAGMNLFFWLTLILRLGR